LSLKSFNPIRNALIIRISEVKIPLTSLIDVLSSKGLVIGVLETIYRKDWYI
jgi:hypothetical protein